MKDEELSSEEAKDKDIKSEELNEEIKKRYKLNKASTGVILATLIVIIVEDALKKDRIFSLLGLSVAFVLMGLTQISNYRITHKKTNIVFAVIYFIAGIANLVYLISQRI